MHAFVITGPGQAEVRDIDPPVAGPGQVIVDVERAGVCGTDVEFFTGHMAYLRTGEERYPVRIGHEWCGVVSQAGPGVSRSWLGRRVTGDTMLGCGRCRRCTGGRQHLCAQRSEIGVRNGWPGALAEQVPVPEPALHPLPDGLDAAMGALVEPGGNALRAVRGARIGPGQRLLVMGPGTIGLLAALIARSMGAEVHLMGREERSLRFARSLGFRYAWPAGGLPDTVFDAVIDASNAAHLPSLAAEIVEPGGRVVYIGLSAQPSLVDSRMLVMKDVTATGVLSASGGLAETISLYADGRVDPRPVVAATVGLDEVAGVLAGCREAAWGDGPKIHVDPRR
jgi:threonine dehydrogenase-like Zn-dependent dehydrogenase